MWWAKPTLLFPPIAQFKGEQPLNRTCAGCTSYRNLDFYRTGTARRIAAENEGRASGVDPAQYNDPNRPDARLSVVGWALPALPTISRYRRDHR